MGNNRGRQRDPSHRNRSMILDSKPFHGGDDTVFRDAFESRRYYVTLSCGKR
ncbi:MAG: hypothetical protein AAFQ62_02080 [Pseudomonadota bacterium]